MMDEKKQDHPTAPRQRAGLSAWSSDDFSKVTTEELAQVAVDKVLESEAYFELWRRTETFVSDVVHSRIRGQDARHMVTSFYCHKLPHVLHKFRPQERGGSFQAWLATVLRNYLNDAWRKGRAHRSRLAELEPYQEERAFAEPSEIEDKIERDHLVSVLSEVMNQVLGSVDQYIIRARYWEDKALKEIARELGLSEESVRVRHWRAKKRLHNVCKNFRESGLL